MQQPGSPGFVAPPREDWLLRRIKDLEATVTQLNAALAGIAATQAQVAFLANQQASAEASPGVVTAIDMDPATADVPVTWLDFDPAADASVTITTSSTASLAVQCGGYIGLWGTNFCYVSGYIGVQVLDSLGGEIRGPQTGDGNMSTIWNVNFFEGRAGAGHRHEWSWFLPNTEYTLRARRGYSLGAGGAGAVARVEFQGTSIDVEKLGM